MTRARDVANLIGSGNFSSTTFTATAGQTAFTISHTQGFIQVFMNGSGAYYDANNFSTGYINFTITYLV